MKSKYSTTIIILLIAAVVGVYFILKQPVVIKGDTVYLEWMQKDLAKGQYGEPFSEVSLKITGTEEKTVKIGKFSNCSKPNEPEKQAIIALSCWWAGAGDNLTVELKTAGELNVILQEVDERPEGVSLPPPKILKTIIVPKDAKILAK